MANNELPSPARCAAIRRAHGFSQRETALYVGVSPITLGAWERGERSPRGEKYRKAYADFLRWVQDSGDIEPWPETDPLPSPERRRWLRTLAGLSQQDVATEIGVATGTVSKWENGWALPAENHLHDYASLLRQLETLEEVRCDSTARP